MPLAILAQNSERLPLIVVWRAFLRIEQLPIVAVTGGQILVSVVVRVSNPASSCAVSVAAIGTSARHHRGYSPGCAGHADAEAGASSSRDAESRADWR